MAEPLRLLGTFWGTVESNANVFGEDCVACGREMVAAFDSVFECQGFLLRCSSPACWTVAVIVDTSWQKHRTNTIRTYCFSTGQILPWQTMGLWNKYPDKFFFPFAWMEMYFFSFAGTLSSRALCYVDTLTLICPWSKFSLKTNFQLFPHGIILVGTHLKGVKIRWLLVNCIKQPRRLICWASQADDPA